MTKLIKATASLLLSVFLLGGFFFMVSVKPAHAYIELGSIGLMLQMLIASAFGVAFTLKIYWHNITGKISRFFAKIGVNKNTPE